MEEALSRIKFSTEQACLLLLLLERDSFVSFSLIKLGQRHAHSGTAGGVMFDVGGDENIVGEMVVRKSGGWRWR